MQGAFGDIRMLITSSRAPRLQAKKFCPGEPRSRKYWAKKSQRKYFHFYDFMRFSYIVRFLLKCCNKNHSFTTRYTSRHMNFKHNGMLCRRSSRRRLHFVWHGRMREWAHGWLTRMNIARQIMLWTLIGLTHFGCPNILSKYLFFLNNIGFKTHSTVQINFSTITYRFRFGKNSNYSFRNCYLGVGRWENGRLPQTNLCKFPVIIEHARRIN